MALTETSLSSTNQLTGGGTRKTCRLYRSSTMLLGKKCVTNSVSGEKRITGTVSRLWMSVKSCLMSTHLNWEMTSCLQELKRQFPDSHRVKRLAGMRLEALERYEDANKLYDSILQDDPTNTAARKRKISILRAQGKSSEAIRELNEYLEQFVGDQEAWHELSELYINEHDYAKAAFCLEELMMTNPHNHLYCEQYAEVKYTQGGLENLELARKYFAQALKLNNRNMRALFGLYMSASHIAASPKVSAKVKKDNMKYGAWAASQISRAYQVRGVHELLVEMGSTT
uniref:ER membrane protein complex subunit 2 n=1 Tax=Sinocyclocheilus grahami TaxID=75366 RepID=A0A672LSG8_SINGR